MNHFWRCLPPTYGRSVDVGSSCFVGFLLHFLCPFRLVGVWKKQSQYEEKPGNRKKKRKGKIMRFWSESSFWYSYLILTLQGNWRGGGETGLESN